MNVTEVYLVSNVTSVEGRTFDYCPLDLPPDAPSPIAGVSFEDALRATVRRSDASDWEVPRYSSKWIAPFVDVSNPPYVDFLPFEIRFPTFSERAVRVLSDLLEGVGEFLPIKTKSGIFYYLNILKLCDALDERRSELSYWPMRPKSIMSIRHYQFHPEKLDGFHFFRVSSEPTYVFASDVFVRRVFDEKLFGFEFRKAWPLPPGTPWICADGIWVDVPASGKPAKSEKSLGKESQSQGQRVPVKLIEKTLPREISSHIPGAAVEGAEICHLNVRAERLAIMKLIDERLIGWADAYKRYGDRFDYFTKIAVPLGSLLGETMARDFGWQWVHLAEGEYADPKLAIVSPDKRFAIYPMQYCLDCIRKDIPPCLELFSNLIASDGFPTLDVDKYGNILASVKRII